MPGPWHEAGREPSVEELLREDIAVQLRRRDGISDEEVREVIAAARAALSERCEPA